MSNRLSKADYLVVYMILFLIAAFIAGFFLGAKVGKGKAEDEFFDYISQMNPEKSEVLKYSHTDFSTYYYNIYLPFNDFRQSYLHFDQQIHKADTLEDQTNKTNDILKEIATLRKQLEKNSAADSSPYLQKSHAQYVLSIKEYERGLKQILESNQTKASEFTTQLDSNLTKARSFRLQGQVYFYEAITLWESIYVTKAPPHMIEKAASYSIDEWKKLRFHQKNELIAKLLKEKNIVGYFNPEDVVVYLDKFATSAQASQVNRVEEAIDIFIASGSIRQGEFLENIQQYSSVDVPMIPLFSK